MKQFKGQCHVKQSQAMRCDVNVISIEYIFFLFTIMQNKRKRKLMIS